LGGGANKSVTAIAINGNDLYIGGDFDTVDGSRMNHIAHWNIAEGRWNPLGDGLSQGFMPQVAALTVYGRNVYAAGYFYTAGSDSVYNIARWDGSRWTALGSGLNGNAFALASNGAEVYVGGAFTQAGDKQSLFFGLWHTPPSGTDAGSASTHSLVSMTNYPNPSTERTIIHLMTTKSAPAEIAVYDVEGRRVALLHEGTLEAGEHDLTWESESAPPGMYVCRARVGETIESTRVIVTR
jgi:hypothetical protein